MLVLNKLINVQMFIYAIVFDLHVCEGFHMYRKIMRQNNGVFFNPFQTMRFCGYGILVNNLFQPQLNNIIHKPLSYIHNYDLYTMNFGI